MSFFQQFALNSALAALHTVIRQFGAAYLTQEELAASDVLVDALAQLPERIHNKQQKSGAIPSKP